MIAKQDYVDCHGNATGLSRADWLQQIVNRMNRVQNLVMLYFLSRGFYGLISGWKRCGDNFLGGLVRITGESSEIGWSQINDRSAFPLFARVFNQRNLLL